MKLEGYLFVMVAAFFAVSDLIYWFTSHEPAGTAAMALASGLGILVSSYLLFTARRIEPRPEDLDDAEISDGAGEIGFFSPHSWAPLWCAGSAAVCFIGIVFGWWLFIIGIGLAIPAIGSMVFEYYTEAAHS